MYRVNNQNKLILMGKFPRSLHIEKNSQSQDKDATKHISKNNVTFSSLKMLLHHTGAEIHT